MSVILGFCQFVLSVKLLGDLKEYTCFIKRKMHNKKEIFKIEIFLNYQWPKLNFDIFVIFGCHLAEI